MPWAGNAAPSNSYGDTVGLGGDYSIVPNLTGKPQYTKGKATVGPVSGYQYVSNAGFSQPASWFGGPDLGFGNVGRDAVVGPGRTQLHHLAIQVVRLREAAHFEFRADSFNTFNHTQFNGLADTNPQNQDFGFVNSAQDPRTFELGGKFVF